MILGWGVELVALRLDRKTEGLKVEPDTIHELRAGMIVDADVGRIRVIGRPARRTCQQRPDVLRSQPSNDDFIRSEIISETR